MGGGDRSRDSSIGWGQGGDRASTGRLAVNMTLLVSVDVWLSGGQLRGVEGDRSTWQGDEPACCCRWGGVGLCLIAKDAWPLHESGRRIAAIAVAKPAAAVAKMI